MTTKIYLSGFVGQTFLLMAGRGIAKVINFICFILIARALGPDNYGSFIFAFTFASLLIFIPNLGADPLYTREVSTDRADRRRLLGVVLLLKVIGSVVFLLIYYGGLYLTSHSHTVLKTANFIGVAFVFLSLNQTWSTIFITTSRAELSGVFEVIQSGIFIIIIYFFLTSNSTAEIAAIGFLIGHVIIFLFGFITVWRIQGLPIFCKDLEYIKNIFIQALPLALIWFFSDLYLRVDTAMLFYLKGEYETGIYGASYRLVEAVYSATLVICTIAFPRLAIGWSQGLGVWRKELGNVIRFILLLITIPAVIFTLIPGKLINLLFGPDFVNSADVLRILGPGSFVLCVGSCLGFGLTRINQEGNQLKITFIALFINILLNIFFISYLGSVGAAISTLISGIVYIIIAYYIILHTIKKTKKVLNII